MDMQEAQVKHILKFTSKYEAIQSLHSCIILNFFRALFVLDVPATYQRILILHQPFVSSSSTKKFLRACLDVETGATILLQVSYPHSF